ncbi:MAG: hypothetical protein NWE89_08685 [Candidatus Bathyarchaeota archaeon]|nr:hypothetical protein [Candidatus Bathyarchaeota archaeon]
MSLQGCDGSSTPSIESEASSKRASVSWRRSLHGKGEFLVGFNFANSTGATKMAGSTLVCQVNKQAISSKTIRERQPKDDSLTLLPCTVKDTSNIYLGWAQRSEVIHYHRSLDYLNWCFTDNPRENNYFYSVTRDGSVIGYIVASKAEDDNTLIGLADSVLSDSRPSILHGVLRILVESHSDVHEIELFTRIGGSLENLVNNLNRETGLTYTMIIKDLYG